MNFNSKWLSVIMREKDGLALSSRNIYLDANQRRAAVVLSKSLRKARSVFGAGERNTRVIRTEMETVFASEQDAKVQYISIADPVTLQEIDCIESQSLISMAVYIGKTRLIDNTILGKFDSSLDSL